MGISERHAARAARAADPVRQQLVEVRRGLIRLHKALIDSERRVFELRAGATSNGQFLQLLLHDPFFEWLSPFTALIARIDDALAADDGVDIAVARDMVTRVRELVEPTRAVGDADRYAQVRDRDPDVLAAHLEMGRRLADVEAE